MNWTPRHVLAIAMVCVAGLIFISSLIKYYEETAPPTFEAQKIRVCIEERILLASPPVSGAIPGFVSFSYAGATDAPILGVIAYSDEWMHASQRHRHLVLAGLHGLWNQECGGNWVMVMDPLKHSIIGSARRGPDGMLRIDVD